ncbi:MAG: hypothetical protein KJ666_18455 [Bacteroidetes bacterium]|nr:hypothetical protein [Bacteroidota bacterium]
MTQTEKESQSDWEIFFKKLAERNWIENNLSDFLFALLETSKEFFEIFISLIKDKGELTQEQVKMFTWENKKYIKRELGYEEGRTDLSIEFWDSSKNLTNIVIEVKMWDRDYHAEKMNKYFPNSPKVLLTINFEDLDELKNFIKIKWYDLIEKMEESHNEIIKSISILFKKSTKMEIIELVQKKSFMDILYLNRMFKFAINNSSTDRVKLELYNRSNNFSESESGYFFSLKLNPDTAQEITFYPWLGLNYNEAHGECFMIWLQKEWEKNNFDELGRILQAKFGEKKDNNSGGVSYRPDWDDIVYIMPRSEFDAFFLLETVEDQKQKIVMFLKGYVDEIENKVDLFASKLSTEEKSNT